MQRAPRAKDATALESANHAGMGDERNTLIKMPSEPPESIPFLGPNKLWIGGSDLRSRAAEAAAIPTGRFLRNPRRLPISLVLSYSAAQRLRGEKWLCSAGLGVPSPYFPRRPAPVHARGRGQSLPRHAGVLEIHGISQKYFIQPNPIRCMAFQSQMSRY